MRSLVALALVSSPALAAESTIINGTPEPGVPAVVQILAYPANKSTLYTCTGTVISPTAILTAAHCVDHEASYVYGIYFGADASAYNGQIVNYEPHLKRIASTHIHPMYSRTAPFLADIAVMILAEPTDVEPMVFSREAPTPALVGAEVRIIGYGQSPYGVNVNKKLAADTVVADLDGGADTILVGDAVYRTCVGDSGGPALQGDVILGVNSYSAAGCGEPSHFRRTDAYAAFIDQFAGTMPEPEPEPSDDDGMVDDDGDDDDDDDDSMTAPDDDGGCASAPGAGLLGLVGALGLAKRRRR